MEKIGKIWQNGAVKKEEIANLGEQKIVKNTIWHLNGIKDNCTSNYHSSVSKNYIQEDNTWLEEEYGNKINGVREIELPRNRIWSGIDIENRESDKIILKIVFGAEFKGKINIWGKKADLEIQGGGQIILDNAQFTNIRKINFIRDAGDWYSGWQTMLVMKNVSGANISIIADQLILEGKTAFSGDANLEIGCWGITGDKDAEFKARNMLISGSLYGPKKTNILGRITVEEKLHIKSTGDFRLSNEGVIGAGKIDVESGGKMGVEKGSMVISGGEIAMKSGGGLEVFGGMKGGVKSRFKANKQRW